MEYFSSFKPRYGVLDLKDEIINYNHRFSGLEIRTMYFNNLDYPVTIGTRDGIKYDVYPQNASELPRTFIITKTITYNPNYLRPSLPDPVLSRENQFVYDKAFKDITIQNTNNPRTANSLSSVITFQYTVDNDDFIASPCYYLDDLDIVVSNRRSDIWYHPKSPDGIRHYKIVEHAKLNKVNSFTLDIEIISPDDTISQKFVNINNHIFQVPIINDNLRKPGIYISYNNKTDLKTPPSPPIVDFYDITELNKPFEGKNATTLPIRLFNTIQDAMIQGDLNRQREHELEQLKHNNKQLMVELEQMKLEAAKAETIRSELEAERKQRTEEIKNILDSRDKIRGEVEKEFSQELEKERLKLQHQFREREHEFKLREMERKESSDFMKWLPTFLGAAISLATIFIKTSK